MEDRDLSKMTKVDFEFSDDLTKFAPALRAAQRLIVPAKKDTKNDFLHTKYADLRAVLEACKKPMLDNGLCLMQMPVSNRPDMAGIVTTLLHDSGQYARCRTQVPVKSSDAQGFGSAFMYSRRYAVEAFFNIEREDDDGHAATLPAKPRPLADTVAKVQAAFPGSVVSPNVGLGSIKELQYFYNGLPREYTENGKARMKNAFWCGNKTEYNNRKVWGSASPVVGWEQWLEETPGAPLQKTTQEVLGDDQMPESDERNPPPFDDKYTF